VYMSTAAVWRIQ